MITKINHKYNIGHKHFEIDENGQNVKEYKITKIVVTDNEISYTINRSPDGSFANETELKEEEINNTIEDWIKRKTQEYKDKITEIANK